MIKRKPITTEKDGQLHGYQQWYNGDALLFRAIFKHDKPWCYTEWHGHDKHTTFYII